MWGRGIYLVCVLRPGAESLRSLQGRPPPSPKVLPVGGDAPQRCGGLTQVRLDPEVLPLASPAGPRPIGVVLTCLRVGLAARSVDCGIRTVSGP